MTILHSILIKPFYQEGEKTYNFNLGSEALIILVFLQIYQPLVSWDKQKRKWLQIGSSYARRAWEGVFFHMNSPDNHKCCTPVFLLDFTGQEPETGQKLEQGVSC